MMMNLKTATDAQLCAVAGNHQLALATDNRYGKMVDQVSLSTIKAEWLARYPDVHTPVKGWALPIHRSAHGW